MLRVISSLVLLICDFSFVIASPIDENVLALADKALLPKRKILADKDNAYFNTLEFNDDVDNFSDLIPEIRDPEAYATVLPKFREQLLSFRASHLPQREEFLKLGNMQCVVPESNAFLIRNLTGIQDRMIIYLKSDLAYLLDKKPPAIEAEAMLSKHVNFANMFLTCEGSVVEGIIAVSMLNEIKSDIEYLESKKIITKENMVALRQTIRQNLLSDTFLTEVIKRVFKFEFLRAMSLPSELFPENTALFDLPKSMQRTQQLFKQLLTTVDKKSSFVNKKEWSWFDNYIAQAEQAKKLSLKIEEFVDKDSSPANRERLQHLAKQYKNMENLLGKILLKLMSTNLRPTLEQLRMDIAQLHKNN